jgi:hypothetical protein
MEKEKSPVEVETSGHRSKIILALLLLSGCAAPKYTTDITQAGLLEPVILNKDCVLESVDTVYNPLGGALKVLHIKCKEQSKYHD